jgi:hypothetical protein
MDLIGKYYEAIGILNYKNNWLILETPFSINLYYKWWIEKFIGKKISTPLYGSHVTIIAGKYTDVSNHPNWAKYQDKKIPFKYSSIIYGDDNYFWLNVICGELADIRKELGLSPDPHWSLHLTIGFLYTDKKMEDE